MEGGQFQQPNLFLGDQLGCCFWLQGAKFGMTGLFAYMHLYAVQNGH